MNFKKCYPLTDRTKSRDAVASKNHKKFSCIFVRLPKVINSKKIVAERVKTKSSFQDVIKQQSTCANCRNKPVGVYVVIHRVMES